MRSRRSSASERRREAVVARVELPREALLGDGALHLDLLGAAVGLRLGLPLPRLEAVLLRRPGVLHAPRVVGVRRVAVGVCRVAPPLPRGDVVARLLEGLAAQHVDVLVRRRPFHLHLLQLLLLLRLEGRLLPLPLRPRFNRREALLLGALGEELAALLLDGRAPRVRRRLLLQVALRLLGRGEAGRHWASVPSAPRAMLSEL